jgi:hypothetical protein
MKGVTFNRYLENVESLSEKISGASRGIDVFLDFIRIQL